MMVLVGVALGWLGIGSLIGVAFLKYCLGTGFPEKVDWQLIAAIAVVWPWPVWVWYSSRNISIPETARIGLMATAFMGSLGAGWVLGLNFYDSLYPKESADKVAIGAMIDKIINPKWTGDSTAKNQQTKIGIPPPSLSFR